MDEYLLDCLRAWQAQLNSLQIIPGIDIHGAPILLLDIGADSDAFGSAEWLASQVGICSGNNASAGKASAVVSD